MIPLKTFGLFLCKRAIFPKKSLWIKLLEYIMMPLWNSLLMSACVPPQQVVLFIKGNKHSSFLSFTCSAATEWLHKTTQEAFSSALLPSTRSCLHPVKALFFIFHFLPAPPQDSAKTYFLSAGRLYCCFGLCFDVSAVSSDSHFLKPFTIYFTRWAAFTAAWTQLFFITFFFFARVSAQAEYLLCMWKSSNEFVAVKASTLFSTSEPKI